MTATSAYVPDWQHIDTVLFEPLALRFLCDVAGADKVMLGTDYPFDMGVTDPVERATAAGLPAPGGEPLVHYSPGVDVTIGRPEP